MPKPFRFAELLARIRLRLRSRPGRRPRPRRRPRGRRRTPRRAHPPRHRRRARARALRPRVLPRRDPDGERRPGALPRAAARPGLGLRLRPRLERRRRLRRLPAQEVRRRPRSPPCAAWATASTTELLYLVGCGNPRAECLALTGAVKPGCLRCGPVGGLTAPARAKGRLAIGLPPAGWLRSSAVVEEVAQRPSRNPRSPTPEATFRPQPRHRKPLSTEGFQARTSVGGQCWNRSMTAIAHQPHPVTRALAGARDQLHAVAGVPVWSMDATETTATIDEIQSAKAQLAELEARLLAHADRIELAGHAGATSTANWHAHRTRTTRPAAHRAMRLATGLEDHDPTRAALADGPGPRRAGRGHPPRPGRAPRRPRPRPGREGRAAPARARRRPRRQSPQAPGPPDPRGRLPRRRRRPRSQPCSNARNATPPPPPG